MIQVMFGFDSA